MAVLPSEDDKIRLALDIFKHFGTRPGEGLLPGNFVAVATKNNLNTNDIVDGVEAGKARGLFADGKNGFTLLTEAGFAAI